MSRATNDLNAVRMMIGPAVMYSANTILVFVVAIVLMLSLDTRLTLMALLPLPLVSISVRYFGAAIHKRFEAIQEQLANLSAIVQEALAGVRVVRAYNQEAHEIERFRAANLEFVRRNRVLIRLQGLFFPSMTLFLGFGSLLVLWLGSRHVIRGQLTLGEFVAFNSYLVMLSWPMIAFGWVTNILQRGMASWKRMLEVLDAVPDVADTAVTVAGNHHTIRDNRFFDNGTVMSGVIEDPNPLDPQKAIALLCGPADYSVEPRAAKPTSGLIEQQKWFMKAAHQDMPIAGLPGLDPPGLLSGPQSAGLSPSWQTPTPPSNVGVPVRPTTAGGGIDGWLIDRLYGRR
jgi:ABC-type multidrug transport system fused ATPase/permease subunit